MTGEEKVKEEGTGKEGQIGEGKGRGRETRPPIEIFGRATSLSPVISTKLHSLNVSVRRSMKSKKIH